MDIAVTCDCISFGIEVVESRIQGSISLLEEARKSADINDYDQSPLSNVRFFKDDCSNLKKLCTYRFNDGYEDIYSPTHIYSYNKYIDERDVLNAVKYLIKFGFKILAWSLNKQKTQ